ncbi:hypothetical protein OPKNFCMD_3837 [Methylobacterium crusticola]|uniref:Phage tail assembly protein n=1 Tax=Methylobacterium crusticola TaxID=1697972 RepID=A0ABQ4R1C6_9HYPH|nr:hypothetical protein [Methylobacterium crusticola]GJD51086.1 hypothetical protein OPKNFCMD_3837 [Methylobacterium crusticola]
MAHEVKIPLKTPIITHGGEVREIVLKAPSFDAYMEHGEPYTVAETPDGARYAVESMEVIRAYVADCLVSPADVNLLSQCDARTGREVRKVILGFFQPDGEVTEPSPTSPTTSPSS